MADPNFLSAYHNPAKTTETCKIAIDSRKVFWETSNEIAVYGKLP
jgi:hypothetical protein